MRPPAIVSAAVTVLLLGSLYFVFKNSAAERGSGQPHSGTYRLAIEDQRLDVDPLVFSVTQGDAVTLRITTDRAGSVHVHAYKKEVVLRPDGEVTLTLTTHHAGRYPVHLHGEDGSHLEVAALEVHPR